jgi:hypothetical protein
MNIGPNGRNSIHGYQVINHLCARALIDFSGVWSDDYFMSYMVAKLWNPDSALLLLGGALGAAMVASVDGYSLVTVARFAFVWLAEPFRQLVYFGSYCG